MAGSARKYRYEQLAEELVRLIESGTFRPGSRIPSIRQLSRQKKVSISTVIQSLYLLEAQGWIEARPRSGFYVRTMLPSTLPEPDVSSPEPDASKVSMRELVTRVVLADTHNPHLVQLGAAHPNPALAATQQLNRILNTVARRLGDESGLYDYVPGSQALRAQIARRALAAGCSLGPDDILITSGCTESVSVCLRAVCRPGDTVAIESPISFDALQCLEALGLRALEIPTHPRDGISLDALRFAVEHNPVSACLVISNFNNPLGSCIPDDHKKELVRLLAERDIPLIENDIFGELYFNDRRPPVAKAYDQRGMVMLCSSFSKSLCPAYRVGWVVPGRFKEAVQWLKYTSTLAAPTLSAYAIAEFLEGGSYDPYLRRVRRAYARRVASLSQAVRLSFPEEIRLTRPAGGFLLWVQLPDTVDSLELYRLALETGVAITPGYLFSATQQFRNFIRLNAANWTPEAERAVSRLGDLVGELADRGGS